MLIEHAGEAWRCTLTFYIRKSILFVIEYKLSKMLRFSPRGPLTRTQQQAILATTCAHQVLQSSTIFNYFPYDNTCEQAVAASSRIDLYYFLCGFRNVQHLRFAWSTDMVHVHFAYVFEAQRDFAKVVSQDVVDMHAELHVSHKENKHFLCLVGAC